MYIISTDNTNHLLSLMARADASPMRVTRVPIGIPTEQGFLPALQIQYWVDEPGTYGQQVWTLIETVPADPLTGSVDLNPTLLGKMVAAGFSNKVSLVHVSGSL